VYGCSSNGTVIIFLSLDPHKKFLWSEDNLIIPSSTALIPKFLSCTLSSEASSKNKAGFARANNNRSLLSSLELILVTSDPFSTRIIASAMSISSCLAINIASASSSNHSISLIATLTGSYSVYILSFPGWYKESNFCNTVFSFSTYKLPFLNTIWDNLWSPFISSTKDVIWFIQYFNSLS